jgi:hypothetical protein
MSMSVKRFNIGEKRCTVACINYDEEDIKKESVSVSQIHHIHIVDRSGSIGPVINPLIDNVQATFNAMSEGDIVSVIWFSSPGQFKTLIKGATKTDEIIELMNSLRFCLGTTCFSDPLKEAQIVIEDLIAMCPNISVTLFTDGCPVVPWSIEEEEKRIFEVLGNIKDKVLAVNTIGYGNWYNKELLTAMAATSQYGAFIHSSKIEDYLSIFNRNFEKISDLVGESVEIEAPDMDIIYLNRNFTKMEHGSFHLSNVNRRKNQFFIIGNDDKDFSFTYQGVKYDTGDVTLTMKESTVSNFLYASAYNYYYVGSRHLSLDILGKNLKDKALVDDHLKSFTYDETSEHLKKIQTAIFKKTGRCVDGECSISYIPRADDPCVMDLLKILQTGNAFYIPFSKNVEKYKRATKKTTETFDLFKMTDEEIMAPFGDFVYNKQHINLSIRVVIPGKVSINPIAAKEAKLPNEIESKMFRNYMLIKDGNLNMKEIEVLMDMETFEKVNKFSSAVIPFNNVIEDKIIDGIKYARCVLSLQNIPIINRLYIDKSDNIETLFGVVKEITDLEAKQKVINYFVDNILETSSRIKKEGAFKEFTLSQIKVLEQHGLDKNLVYNGVGVSKASADECDSYETRTMEFYIKGIKSLPKIEDVIAKAVKNEKMTPSMVIVEGHRQNILDKITKEKLDLAKPTVKLRSMLRNIQSDVRCELSEKRNTLNSLKMAKIITGDWFKELTPNDKGEYVYEKDETTMIAKVERSVVYF